MHKHAMDHHAGRTFPWLMAVGGAIAVLGLAFALPARAASTAPGYLDVDVVIEEDRIHVEYAGRALLVPVEGTHATPLLDFGARDAADEAGAVDCQIDYHIEPTEGGFDIALTLSNHTDEPARRPMVMVSGFRLSSETEDVHDDDGTLQHRLDRGFDWLDSRTLGAVRTSMRQWSPWRMHYPNDKYAPVLAAWDEHAAMGVSLIYDPLAAKHDVRGEYVLRGRHLFMGFRLDAAAEDYADRGRPLLPPGEQDTYRIAVRFARPDPTRQPHPGWLDALTPYREHFVRTYGSVRYQRDLRPVIGQPVAQGSFLDPASNPRGYNTHSFGGERVDVVGWGPFVTWLERRIDKGYRRAMIWAPSGLYLKGTNFPPEVLTALPPALVETLPELLALQKRGVSLGMWWGRSSQISAGWNSGEMRRRDARVPNDRQAAYDELDLYAAYGFDMVGFDAFKLMPIWQRYAWLEHLREKYPGLNMITESADCDIMHTLAPTYAQHRRQTQRPVLADWLVPGHESWLQVNFQDVNQETFDRITSWQCVPVTMSRYVPHDVATFVEQ